MKLFERFLQCRELICGLLICLHKTEVIFGLSTDCDDKAKAQHESNFRGGKW